MAERFRKAVAQEQLYDLERLWYCLEDEHGRLARQWLRLVAELGEKYQIDELAAKYAFTGRTPMTIPQALEIKEELETIDRLLKQLEEAAKTGQIGVIDMEELAEYADPGDIEQLNRLARQIEEYLRELAEQQGLARTARGYELTPKAYRLFQGRLLERIFSNLQASRTGRHEGAVVGEGSVELQQTRPYEFGDSLHDLDIPGSLVNAMIRNGPGLPVRMQPEDLLVHRTRNTPKCATVVLLDMSGSMRYNGLYVDVKRMGLALQGLIHRQYPGDHLQFIEVYSFAKLRQYSEIVTLLPKPVSIVRSRGPPAGRHEQPRRERVSRPGPFHQHPAGAATGSALPDGPGHAQPAGDPHHRRPSHGPFRGQVPLSALSARSAAPKRQPCGKGVFASANKSPSTSSCCPPGPSRAKTCSLPIGSPSRHEGGSSSRLARTWIATCSGTI